MIQIHLSPAKVEQVCFVADSPLEEDFDFAAWQAVRTLVGQIDGRLRRAMQDVAREGHLGEVPNP